MVDVEWVPGFPGLFPGARIEHGKQRERTGANIRVICRNQGKTPAWISEKRVAMMICHSPPPKPDFTGYTIAQKGPEPIAVGRKTCKDFPLEYPGAEGIGDNTLIYGVVTYRDSFAPEYKTYFGYIVYGGKRLERLEGYDEYNHDT